MKRTLLLILIAAVGYGLTGLYFVQPDEQVVVRRFGRVLDVLQEPGAHFGLPWGLDRIDRLKPREVKRITLGPINVGGEAVGANLSEFLTADRNLVIVRATVQYSIKDPVAYLFHAASVDDLVAGAGTAALSSVLAGQPVDQAMTLGKQELGISVRSLLQQQVDQYRLGIAVRSVDIGSVEPPPEVAEAFDNVISALRERERMINLARGYADRTHAQAQGQVQRFRDTARAACDRSVLEADGEAERFRNLLAEYNRQPELTSRRLYLEAMAEMLPRFRAKLIVDDASDVDLSIFREELP